MSTERKRLEDNQPQAPIAYLSASEDSTSDRAQTTCCLLQAESKTKTAVVVGSSLVGVGEVAGTSSCSLSVSSTSASVRVPCGSRRRLSSFVKRQPSLSTDSRVGIGNQPLGWCPIQDGQKLFCAAVEATWLPTASHPDKP